MFAKGFVTDYPLTIRHKDGKLTDVLYNASVYKDARGNVLGVFAAARDVTAQKQASQYARSPDRGVARPARHDQPGREDHRRQRGDRSRSPASRARSSSGPTSPTTSPSRRRRARATSRSSRRGSSPTTRSPSATGTASSRTSSTTRRSTRTRSGNVLGVFAAARDVTAQKQASQYARSLIEASLDPLVTISPEGKITDVNEATAKITGVRAREADRDRLLRLLHRAGEGARGVPAGVREGLRHRLPAHHPPQGRQAHRRSLQRVGVQGRPRERPRRVRRRARRDRAEAGVPVRPLPDRGVARPAGHHQLRKERSPT